MDYSTPISPDFLFDTDERLARILYTSYCKAVGGKAFNGEPLPTATEFFHDINKKPQADGWRAVVKTALTEIKPAIDIADCVTWKDTDYRVYEDTMLLCRPVDPMRSDEIVMVPQYEATKLKVTYDCIGAMNPYYGTTSFS